MTIATKSNVLRQYLYIAHDVVPWPQLAPSGNQGQVSMFDRL